MNVRLAPRIRDSSEVHSAGNSMRGISTPSVVLVVDDQELIRNLHRRILTRAGLTVVVADNGRDALAIFEEGRTFDAVVSDIMMPQMDGLTLLRIPLNLSTSSGRT